MSAPTYPARLFARLPDGTSRAQRARSAHERPNDGRIEMNMRKNQKGFICEIQTALPKRKTEIQYAQIVGDVAAKYLAPCSVRLTKAKSKATLFSDDGLANEKARNLATEYAQSIIGIFPEDIRIHIKCAVVESKR